MKIQPMRHGLVKMLLLAILAVACSFFWSTPLCAGGGVGIRSLGDKTFEVFGGEGAQAWRLHYRLSPIREFSQSVLEDGKGSAYFAHAGWLRRIDVKKGVVIGRWRFPGEIQRIALTKDGKLELTLFVDDGSDLRFNPKVVFDPEAPKVPYWPNSQLVLERVSQHEPLLAAPTGEEKVSDEAIRAALPEMEEMVRRDPLSPWLRVSLGLLLKRIGDPLASAKLLDGVRTPGAHFTELFWISTLLDSNGEREAAREAFERGYADFWAKGNDPRMMTALLSRIILTGLGRAAKDLSPEQRRELVERIYLVSPRGEMASYAWDAYAHYFEKNGSAEQARLWRVRAEETRGLGWAGLNDRVGFAADECLLVIIASGLAGVALLLVLFLRYRPQWRFDREEQKRHPERKLSRISLGWEYWSRSDRIAFFTVALAGWLAFGVTGVAVHAILRSAAVPIAFASANLSSPGTIAYLKERLPESPARDVLLGVAYAQAGDLPAAERLFRSTPQFAESWNNLGVVLKQQGKQQEAQQAFEHALQLDPKLAEATYNLGRGTPSPWTEYHQKYCSGLPMLAPPSAEQYTQAFLGGSWASLWPRVLAGPLLVDLRTLFGSATMEPPIVSVLAGRLMMLFVVLAFVLMLFGRRHEVTQPPGKLHAIWEALFPGSSLAWGFLGGLVLVVWFYLLCQDFLLARTGFARILMGIAMPDIARAYGIPAEAAPPLLGVGSIINPGWMWVAVAPAALFLVNAVIVWRSRRN